MRGLMLLLILMTLIASSMVSAQEIEPERPTKEYRIPVAKRVIVDGEEYRCFATSGKDWQDIGHIVVDYRAFFAWARWADERMQLYRRDTDAIIVQRDAWKGALDEAKRTTGNLELMFDREYHLRMDSQRKGNIKMWLLGAGLAAETAIIIVLAILPHT